MKISFSFLTRWRTAYWERKYRRYYREPRAPKLRQRIRVVYLLLLMFAAGYVGCQDPDSQFGFGALVACIAAMITLLALAVSKVQVDGPNKPGGA